MSYLSGSDLGFLTMEQVSQQRGVNFALLGVTNPRGCFTTSGAPATGSMSAVLQEVQNAASRSIQSNLTQEEVSLILAQQAIAKKNVEELLEHAGVVKSAWIDALGKLQPLKSCWFCSKERKVYSDAWWRAADLLRELTPKSTAAFRSVDFLMIFAQSPAEAKQLCEAKINARTRYEAILGQIEPIVKQVNAEEAAVEAGRQGLIEKLLAMFQAFMEVLKALIGLIAGAFKGLADAAGFVAGTIAPFVAANPRTVLYSALGVVAAGVGLVGFIKYRQAKFALTGRI